jgi:hypothetical protein
VLLTGEGGVAVGAAAPGLLVPEVLSLTDAAGLP